MAQQEQELQLTKEQIANWKQAFPEFWFATDEMIQRLRDQMQRRIDEDKLRSALSGDNK